MNYLIYLLAIGFAFAYSLERERKEKILKNLPENIKKIYINKPEGTK